MVNQIYITIIIIVTINVVSQLMLIIELLLSKDDIDSVGLNFAFMARPRLAFNEFFKFFQFLRSPQYNHPIFI